MNQGNFSKNSLRRKSQATSIQGAIAPIEGTLSTLMYKVYFKGRREKSKKKGNKGREQAEKEKRITKWKEKSSCGYRDWCHRPRNL
jgi:hypothetical protein